MILNKPSTIYLSIENSHILAFVCDIITRAMFPFNLLQNLLRFHSINKFNSFILIREVLEKLLKPKTSEI